MAAHLTCHYTQRPISSTAQAGLSLAGSDTNSAACRRYMDPIVYAIFCWVLRVQVMLQRLRAGTDAALLQNTEDNLHAFSVKGLRTLIVGARVGFSSLSTSLTSATLHVLSLHTGIVFQGAMGLTALVNCANSREVTAAGFDVGPVTHLPDPTGADRGRVGTCNTSRMSRLPPCCRLATPSRYQDVSGDH